MKALIVFLLIAVVGLGVYFLLKAKPRAGAGPVVNTSGPGGIMGWINSAVNTVNNVTTSISNTVDGADHILNTGEDIVSSIREDWNNIF